MRTAHMPWVVPTETRQVGALTAASRAGWELGRACQPEGMSRGPCSDGGPPLRTGCWPTGRGHAVPPPTFPVRSLARAPTWPAAPPSPRPSSSAGAAPPAPCPAAAAPGRPPRCRPTAAGGCRGSGRPCAGAGLSWPRLPACPRGPWGHGSAPAQPQHRPWARGPRVPGWLGGAGLRRGPYHALWTAPSHSWAGWAGAGQGRGACRPSEPGSRVHTWRAGRCSAARCPELHPEAPPPLTAALHPGLPHPVLTALQPPPPLPPGRT